MARGPDILRAPSKRCPGLTQAACNGSLLLQTCHLPQSHQQRHAGLIQAAVVAQVHRGQWTKLRQSTQRIFWMSGGKAKGGQSHRWVGPRREEELGSDIRLLWEVQTCTCYSAYGVRGQMSLCTMVNCSCLLSGRPACSLGWDWVVNKLIPPQAHILLQFIFGKRYACTMIITEA